MYNLDDSIRDFREGFAALRTSIAAIVDMCQRKLDNQYGGFSVV